MPVNPMQRRIRNSFLIGFLVAVLIGAAAIALLMFKMKEIKDENAKLMDLQKEVYVAATDLESGEVVTIESFMMSTVQTAVDEATIVNLDDFSFLNEEGEIDPKYNEDGSEKKKEVVMKVSVPAGTIVTKEMIADSTADISNDIRIQEFNMISLPSQLKTGDYIDIRLSLPTGQDYIVLAKKRVIDSTETGIWLRLSEEETLTMNNAIVESYRIIGSKIYAREYAEPGIQAAATPTYPVSAAVLQLIQYSPNIVEEARVALYNRYFENDHAQAVQRNTVIEPALAENALTSNPNDSVEQKNQEEISKVQAAREEYVSSLGE